EGVPARARGALLSRLERQPVVQAAHWRRDELYENDR
ncbi:MAG: type II toxin-antitoxin system prevent-host-death family antitoxin, partial [Mesorhizobium sp.]